MVHEVPFVAGAPHFLPLSFFRLLRSLRTSPGQHPHPRVILSSDVGDHGLRNRVIECQAQTECRVQ